MINKILTIIEELSDTTEMGVTAHTDYWKGYTEALKELKEKIIPLDAVVILELAEEVEKIEQGGMKYYRDNGHVRNSVALSHYWEGKLDGYKQILKLIKNNF